MLLIKIPARAAKALGRPRPPQNRRPGNRCRDTATHPRNSRPPAPDAPSAPASRRSSRRRHQAQHARGQIGIALALGQDQKPAVVDDQPKPAGALARTPANPALARFEMQGRGTEGQQRDPLPVQFGHIAQRLANQSAALKIMFLLKQRSNWNRSSSRSRRTVTRIQNIRFALKMCQNHAASFGVGR